MTNITCALNDCKFNSDGKCTKIEIDIGDGEFGQMCLDYEEVEE